MPRNFHARLRDATDPRPSVQARKKKQFNRQSQQSLRDRLAQGQPGDPYRLTPDRAVVSQLARGAREGQPLAQRQLDQYLEGKPKGNAARVAEESRLQQLVPQPSGSGGTTPGFSPGGVPLNKVGNRPAPMIAGGTGTVGGTPGGDAMTDLNADAARNLIDEINARFAREQDSLRGFLGQNNALYSGLGGDVLADQQRGVQRDRLAVANELARSELAAQQQAASQANQLALQREQLALNRELGLGELSLNAGQLALQRDLGMGDIGLRLQDLSQRGEMQQAQLGLQRDEQQFQQGFSQQQLQQQADQFRAQLAYDGSQADINRAFQLGVLGMEQDHATGQQTLQQQHEVTLADQAAQIQSTMQERDHAFEMGRQAVAQKHQAREAEASRQQERDLQDVQIASQIKTLAMQLADQAATRTDAASRFEAEMNFQMAQLAAQIEQNRSENLLTQQEIEGNVGLGLAELQNQAIGQDQDFALRSAQFEAGLANDQAANNLAMLTALSSGAVDLNHPLVASMVLGSSAGGQPRRLNEHELTTMSAMGQLNDDSLRGLVQSGQVSMEDAARFTPSRPGGPFSTGKQRDIEIARALQPQSGRGGAVGAYVGPTGLAPLTSIGGDPLLERQLVGLGSKDRKSMKQLHRFIMGQTSAKPNRGDLMKAVNFGLISADEMMQLEQRIFPKAVARRERKAREAAENRALADAIAARQQDAVDAANRERMFWSEAFGQGYGYN